jgi:hypothetical protein
LSRDADREEAPPHAGRALISTWLMVTETAQRPLGSGRRSMQAPDAMRTQLYGAAFDPRRSIVIGATAWIACWLPARRASIRSWPCVTRTGEVRQARDAGLLRWSTISAFFGVLLRFVLLARIDRRTLR